jgi:hypothetical protein
MPARLAERARHCGADVSTKPVSFVLKRVALTLSLVLIAFVQTLWWLRARLYPDSQVSWILASGVINARPTGKSEPR